MMIHQEDGEEEDEETLLVTWSDIRSSITRLDHYYNERDFIEFT